MTDLQHSILQMAMKPVGGVVSSPAPVVVLADEVEGIEQRILEYVSLTDPRLALLTAFWVTNTYAFQRFAYSGYLSIGSATPACGKSRFLGLVAALSHGNPAVETCPTAAALLRSDQKVWFFDEVDKMRNQDGETYGVLMAIFNMGFQADGVVSRAMPTDDGDWKCKKFRVYGPKAFAGLEQLNDALRSRCFVITMERADTRLPRLNLRKLRPEFKELSARLEQWAGENGDLLNEVYDQIGEELPDAQDYDDRYLDISEPLLAIARVADRQRPNGLALEPRLREALKIAYRHRTASNHERGLHGLLDIVEQELGGQDEIFLSTLGLLTLCADTEELGWIENGRQFASWVKRFDLVPCSNGMKRGYRVTRQWLEKWSRKYGRGEKAIEAA